MSKQELNNINISKEDMNAFHPLIRNIIFASNHFEAIGLEVRHDYTDSEIEAAFQKKIAEVNKIINNPDNLE